MIVIKRIRLLGTGAVLTFFFLSFFGMFSLHASASPTPAKLLSVSARVSVKWNHTVEEHHKTEGSLTLQINGTMKQCTAGSPAVHKANRTFMPVLTYKPEVMSVAYTYDETKTSLRPIPKDMKCQDPLIYEYTGGGVSQIIESAGLNIRRFSSMAAPYLKTSLRTKENSWLTCRDR